MKERILVIALATVSALVMKQAKADETPMPLFVLGSGPGYVMPKDEYSKVCTITDMGVVEYEYESSAGKDGFKSQLSAGQLAELKHLVKVIQERNVTPPITYETAYGDIPGFEFAVYPDLMVKGELIIHQDGKDITGIVPEAKKLLRKVTSLCKMQKEIRKQRRFEIAAHGRSLSEPN